MSKQPTAPDFDSIKQINPYDAEYWSGRQLSKLLGYTDWRNFETAIKRAKTACEQTKQPIENHFANDVKKVRVGSGAERELEDVMLSRFACYLIAQNGDPRKPQIAAAQVYFSLAARENELRQLYQEQVKRLELRERVSENNKTLSATAYAAGVLSQNLGAFHNAGYEGLYGGRNVEQIKAHKGINSKEDILDRMGSSELAANDFRITQTRDKLQRDNVIGQSTAIETHREVGSTVRKAIEEIGGTMPEELPAEPSIKALLSQKKRNHKKALTATPSEETAGQDKPAEA